MQHTGYTDPALRQRKLQRDLRLLEMEQREQPHDPFTLFNLGATYAELRRHDDALPMLQESLARSHASDSIVRKLYALIANCHLSRRRTDEALKACAQGQAVCPGDQELLFLEALIRTEQGDLQGAKAVLLRLLGGEDGQHFASVVDGLRGHKGQHQLALVCLRLGELPEAERSGSPCSAIGRNFCRRELAWANCTWRKADGRNWKKGSPYWRERRAESWMRCCCAARRTWRVRSSHPREPSSNRR